MKRGIKFPVLLIFIIWFTGCEMSMTDNSGLDTNSIIDLGSEIGKKWENTQATNITVSKSGNWDCMEIDDPVVIKKGNTYMMWYSGRGPDNKWRIGYASSSDGINWTKDYANNPVIDITEGAIDSQGARLSSVIYDEEQGIYKMWYRGYDQSVNIGYLNCWIIYAKSEYGNREWYKNPANKDNKSLLPIAVTLDKNSGMSNLSDKFSPDKEELGKLCVYKYVYKYAGSDVTNYIMWYTYDVNKGVSNFLPAIMTAYSDNETNFISNSLDTLINYKGDGSILKDGYCMPTAIRDYYNGKMIYKMWYMSYVLNYKETRKAGYAINETDGMFYTAYTKDDPNKPEPIFAEASISQDAEDIKNPTVIRDGDKYKMWYTGTANGMDLKTKTICYKESINH